MKRLMFALALCAAITASADNKIGTVDMLLLVRNHASYDTNKSLLADTQKDYTKKLEKIKAGLEDLQKEGKKLYEQMQNPMMAAAAKSKVEKELTDIQQKLLGGQQQLRSEAMRSEQEMQALEARLLKSTTEDLKKKISEFARQTGYTLVLDVAACPYSDGTVDVTPAILKAMGVDPEKAKKPGEDDEGK